MNILLLLLAISAPLVTPLFKDVPGLERFSTLHEEQIPEKILKSPEDTRERISRLFLEHIREHEKNSSEKESCGRLFKKFYDEFDAMPDDKKSKFSDPFYKLLESSKAQFYWCFPKKEITEIGKFPEYTLSLRGFSSVKTDPEVVAKMFLQETDVNRHAMENSELREKIARYDQEHKTAYLHSVIQAKNSPKMVVIGTPRTDKDDTVNLFFKAVIDANVSLIIALNTASDWEKAIAYYDDAILQTVDVDGWRVQSVGSQVLYTGDVAKNIPKERRQGLLRLSETERQKVLQSDAYKEFFPSIIERTLVFTHSDTGERRQVVHLHYKHWPDRAPAPDLDGLFVMLKRHAEILSTQKEPSMLIHCQGGVGRTNFYAILSWIMREIDLMLEKGIDPIDSEHNIPEMMYELKQQAPRLGGMISGERFAQIYEMAYRYYLYRVFMYK